MGKNLPKKACTGRVGLCAFFEMVQAGDLFRFAGWFSPLAGNAGRWAAIQIDRRCFEGSVFELMSNEHKEWMSQELWASLVNGENCPLCLENESSALVSDHGYVVADLEISRLRLSMNQFVVGYCVLICKKHIQEPHHLSREEQILFFQDLMRASQAIEQVFNPIKMNFQILGNLVPHLHVHITPRYYGDTSPGRPIDPYEQRKILSLQEYQERICLIREALTLV
jgi:diadenosine tetraphosphate (Ap4A) HIT family hydrolase